MEDEESRITAFAARSPLEWEWLKGKRTRLSSVLRRAISETGKLTDEQFEVVRGEIAKSSAKKAARRPKWEMEAEQERQRIELFSREHPAEWEWIESNTAFDFAESLRRQVLKRGELSSKQLEAAQLAVERTEAHERILRQKEAVREAAAPQIESGVLLRSLQCAESDPELRYPKLRFMSCETSIAGPRSINAGSIYIKKDGQYLGKIKNGKLLLDAPVSDTEQTQIIKDVANPLPAALAYGRVTGLCSGCGFPLNQEFASKGTMDDDCAESFGFSLEGL